MGLGIARAIPYNKHMLHPSRGIYRIHIKPSHILIKLGVKARTSQEAALGEWVSINPLNVRGTHEPNLPIPPNDLQVHINHLLTVWTDLGGQCSPMQNHGFRTTLIIGWEGGWERETIHYGIRIRERSRLSGWRLRRSQ